MVEITRRVIILEKTDLEFENEGVFNPAVIAEGHTIHLFYRAVSKGNHSTIGYCRLDAPTSVAERYAYPVIIPEYDYERHGVEDPRIVKIDDLFYLTYTAYDGINALGALAISSDLKTFLKVGIVAPQINHKEFQRMVKSAPKVTSKYFRFDQCSEQLWDKNVVFFPRRINNKLVFLHRIRPGIQLVSVDKLEQLTTAFWNDYFLNFSDHIVLDPHYEHELSYIGSGCPPIETDAGWLLIYHSVQDTMEGYIYQACAALLDRDEPTIEIARLPYPLFGPEKEWEISGEVNNVCFPTGAILLDGELYIYYGAADERIACASVKLSDLIAELLKNTSKS